MDAALTLFASISLYVMGSVTKSERPLSSFSFHICVTGAEIKSDNEGPVPADASWRICNTFPILRRWQSMMEVCLLPEAKDTDEKEGRLYLSEKFESCSA